MRSLMTTLLTVLVILLGTKGVLFDLDQFDRPIWPFRTRRWPRRPTKPSPHASGRAQWPGSRSQQVRRACPTVSIAVASSRGRDNVSSRLQLRHWRDTSQLSALQRLIHVNASTHLNGQRKLTSLIAFPRHLNRSGAAEQSWGQHRASLEPSRPVTGLG